MSLSDDVANFLLSNEQHVRQAVSKLDFYVQGFRVDPEGYREIGHKIRQGAVTVATASSSSGSQVSAVYTPARDRISVSSNINLAGSSGAAVIHQSTIIHEVTHALMDYHRFRASDTVQEVAAYVAGNVYALAHRRRLSSRDAQSQAILATTQNIVIGRNMWVTTGARLQLSDPDVARLAQAIRGHSSYPDADAVRASDGIAGGLINPWYLPRHRS